MYSKQMRYSISRSFVLCLVVQVGVILLIVYREHLFVRNLFRLQKQEQQLAQVSTQLHDALRHKETLYSLAALRDTATQELGWQPLHITQVRPLYDVAS
jgi:hypothetical protein